MRAIRIFCPKCRWVPQDSDLRMCQPGCGCHWNTFDTCGICPQCGRNWEDTQCLACHRWSRHADWYHELIPERRQEVIQTAMA